jgi:Ni/Co efflux regulator RcnB
LPDRIQGESNAMKKLVATAIFAVAALATPLAIGQSQGIKLDTVNEMASGAAQAVQARAALFAPPRASRSGSMEPGASSVNPDPATSWLMALAVLGIIAIRRTRSSSMR